MMNKKNLLRNFVAASFLVIGVFLQSAMADDTRIQLPNSDSRIQPFYLEYTVGNNLIKAGIAKLSLTSNGDEWVYSLITEPSGIFRLTGKGHIHEVSIINLSDDELIPQSYSYKQSGNEKKRNVDAFFNWDEKELKIKRKGGEATEELKDPILDRLSVTLAVMEQVRKGFTQAELKVLDSGKVKSMRFINEGTVRLKTKLGTFDTVVVRRIREGSSRETITWFAPELNYVPVQMEQLKRGELVARLKINRLEQTEPAK